MGNPFCIAPGKGAGAIPPLASPLRAADARVELINAPGAPHNFDMITSTPEAKAAIDRALAFAARR